MVKACIFISSQVTGFDSSVERDGQMRCRELFQVLVGLAAVMLGASGPRVAASAGAQGRRTRDRGSDRSRGRAAMPVVSAPESPCIDPQTGQEKNVSKYFDLIFQ